MLRSLRSTQVLFRNRRPRAKIVGRPQQSGARAVVAMTSDSAWAMLKSLQRFLVIMMAGAAVGCGATARLTVADGTGANPVLPAPRRSLLPTVNVVSAKGWLGEEKPLATEGTTVSAFARGLDHPRGLYVLPNGDVVVAVTNAPPRSSG